MPIYEYQCNSCQHKLELLCKQHNEVVAICPACQGSDLSRVVSATSFQLKGGGWYVSDYAQPKRTTASTDAASSPSTDTKASSTATSDNVATN